MVSSIENDSIFLFDQQMTPKKVLRPLVRVDVGVKSMLGYTTLSQISIMGVSPHLNGVSYSKHPFCLGEHVKKSDGINSLGLSIE